MAQAVLPEHTSHPHTPSCLHNLWPENGGGARIFKNNPKSTEWQEVHWRKSASCHVPDVVIRVEMTKPKTDAVWNIGAGAHMLHSSLLLLFELHKCFMNANQSVSFIMSSTWSNWPWLPAWETAVAEAKFNLKDKPVCGGQLTWGVQQLSTQIKHQLAQQNTSKLRWRLK